MSKEELSEKIKLLSIEHREKTQPLYDKLSILEKQYKTAADIAFNSYYDSNLTDSNNTIIKVKDTFTIVEFEVLLQNGRNFYLTKAEIENKMNKIAPGMSFEMTGKKREIKYIVNLRKVAIMLDEVLSNLCIYCSKLNNKGIATKKQYRFYAKECKQLTINN